MRWRNRRTSSNVEDRRGQRVRPGIAGGGIGAIVVVLLALYFGVDPRPFLQLMQETSVPASQPGAELQVDVQDDPLAEFVSVVLADTEETWNALFRQLGRQYEEPRLVLFTGMTQSSCGLGQAAMGPFYCPADKQVYIDLSFYRDMRDRFRAPGDFAQAYVIAHEVGHHVQNLLGISGQVQRLRQTVSRTEGNALSVRLELQADCLAGVWAHEANRLRSVLEQGDVEEGLNAASAIGDDRLQRQTQGRVSPDSFTHGSSAQRVQWFKRGLGSGDIESCDTFDSGVQL
jgi:predicted metalloprotease